MLQSLLFLNALCFGVGMPLVCQENTQEIQEKVEFKQDNRKFVSYNDETYTISFSVDELNNYTWDNFSSIIDDTILVDSSIIYSSDTFNYALNSEYMFLNYSHSSYRIRFFTADNLPPFEENKFYLVELTSDNLIVHEFASGFDLVLSSSYYSGIKQAIELDIQANSNTQPHLQPVLTELVSLLTAGITVLASGIGQGVSTLVSDIFINNGALSTFGAVICIFGGIALAIGLCRWVMNFLTSLGAKK